MGKWRAALHILPLGVVGCLLTVPLDGLSGDNPGMASTDSGDALAQATGTLDGSTNDALGASSADGADGANDGSANDADVASTYASEVLADRPVLYLRLGESGTTAPARDSTSFHRDGSFGGAVKCGVPGAIRRDADTACRFDGTSSAVHVSNAGLVFSGRASYSVEAWARPTSVTADHGVFSIAGHDELNDGYLLLVGTDTRPYIFRETGVENGGASGFMMDLGVYHHIVGTYDGTTQRLYVDGALAGTGPAVQSIPGKANIPFTIGADGSGNNQPFIGDIDEVAVYDYPLSAERAAAHFRAGQKP